MKWTNKHNQQCLWGSSLHQERGWLSHTYSVHCASSTHSYPSPFFPPCRLWEVCFQFYRRKKLRLKDLVQHDPTYRRTGLTDFTAAVKSGRSLRFGVDCPYMNWLFLSQGCPVTDKFLVIHWLSGPLGFKFEWGKNGEARSFLPSAPTLWPRGVSWSKDSTRWGAEAVNETLRFCGSPPLNCVVRSFFTQGGHTPESAKPTGISF